MAELLLELLSEEIPARMQARAAEDLKRLVTERLKEEKLSFERAEAYATPRRLALVVDGLPEKQPNRTEERKGPRVGAPDNAIQGFLKSAGLTSLDQCEVREVKGVEHYFVVNRIAGLPTSRVLSQVLGDALDDVPWPKSMRWSDKGVRWIRPLHSILATFRGHALETFDYDVIRTIEALKSPSPNTRITASNSTRGHRFLAPEPFEVTGFADYKAKLEKAYVVLDPAERKRRIAEQAGKLVKKDGLAVRDDPALLDEVAGLVEWPVVLMGSIGPAFMDLPAEVLTAAMRTHQKYFALEDKTGKLAPKFLVVANTEAEDGGTAITAGNERVLRARLADAQFFWDQDRKHTLESRVPALNGVVFHAKLGSLGDKVDRVEALAVALAKHVPGAEAGPARSAARLAKADLVTEMVGEFPELQGVMGRYYALADGERPEVAEAVAEHYSPLGPNDRCPAAPVSVAVALADKIDTLVGFFAIGEAPTGSKDPYALRRAALGVIRLVVENGLRLPFERVFRAAAGAYAQQVRKPDAAAVSEALLAFFAERLKVHLRERGVRHDLITAIFARGDEDDLVRLLARVEALGGFLDTDDGANLLVAYRRAANIVRIEEKKDKTAYGGPVDAKRLAEERERALYAALDAAVKEAEAARDKEDFTAAMAALSKLRRPIDLFFDEVTVNVDEKPLRENRLRLLSQIRGTMDRVADFSKIEG